MFARGSRYRNLPESASLNARGERAIGKELRLIPHTEGRFLHTVNERDRLDLLAFKYYGDPVRWWQISDANPQFPFPTDLLDGGSKVVERLALIDIENASRFANLLAALNAIGNVRAQSSSFVNADVTVAYDNSTQRAQLLAAVRQNGFQLLRSNSWTPSTGRIAEAFALEDRSIKTRWRRSIDELKAMAGILELRSTLAEASLDVIYNAAMIDRGDIVLSLSRNGFAISPQQSTRAERVGAKIVIPPDGVL